MECPTSPTVSPELPLLVETPPPPCGHLGLSLSEQFDSIADRPQRMADLREAYYANVRLAVVVVGVCLLLLLVTLAVAEVRRTRVSADR